MNTSNSLLSLFEYKAWANAQMLQALLKFDDATAAIRTMNHMYVVDRIFVAHLTGTKHGYTAANTPETPSVEALTATTEETDAWFIRYVSALTPAQLADIVHFTFTDGQRGSMSRWEILLHVVTHGTYHRGAVGRMFAERGLATPPDTFTRFLHFAEPDRRVDEVY